MNIATLRQKTAELSTSSEQQITAGTEKWAKNERFSTAMLITHLAEMSAKRLYIDRATSMFYYCTDVLHLEPGCVWLRLQVASCCRKYPELLDEIVAGTISLSVAALLAPQLAPENKISLIALAKNKPKRLVEELLADLKPKEPANPGIRIHPTATTTAVLPFEVAGTELNSSKAAKLISPEISAHPMTPPTEIRPKIIPLGNQRYDLKFTFDAAQKAKLERLGELLGIAAYGPHLATLMERALDIALKAKDPQLKNVKKQATQTAQKQDNLSRYVSMALKKEVLERAEYRCQHQSFEGVRCGQRSSLQIDHIKPLAWGGTTCSENLQILCPPHHRRKTEVQQGPWVVRKK